MNVDTLRAALIETAETEMSNCPQYEGHWDGWDVAIVKRLIHDKWGDLMADVGTLLLAKPRLTWLDLSDSDVVYLDSEHHWSGRMARDDRLSGSPRGCDTSIGHGKIERL